jgi:hypothetical protein
MSESEKEITIGGIRFIPPFSKKVKAILRKEKQLAREGCKP